MNKGIHIAIILTMVFVPVLSLAQGTTNRTTTTVINVATETRDQLLSQYRNTTNQEARITALKDLGDNLISRRLSSLENAQKLLTNAERISEDTKTSLMNSIQSNIQNLSSLQTDIAAETDVDTLKNLVHSIIIEYRIYMVFLPQTHGFAVVDRLYYLSEKLEEFVIQLNATVLDLEEAGIDTNTIEEKIASAVSSMVTAEEKIVEAESLLSQMTIEDPEGGTELAAQAREAIGLGRDSLNNSFSLLREALSLIKQSSE